MKHLLLTFQVVLDLDDDNNAEKAHARIVGPGYELDDSWISIQKDGWHSQGELVGETICGAFERGLPDLWEMPVLLTHSPEDGPLHEDPIAKLEQLVEQVRERDTRILELLAENRKAEERIRTLEDSLVQAEQAEQVARREISALKGPT